jgi:polyhydroxybutyrate depolymerase
VIRTRGLVRACMVVCAAGLVACSGGNGDTTSPTKTSTSTTAAGAAATGGSATSSGSSGGPAGGGVRRSAGCASPAAPATDGTVQVGGASRRYLLALPGDLRAPAPVVLDLHGLGEPAPLEAAYTRLGPIGTAAGMIVVTPTSDNPQNSWAYPVLNPKDANFVGAILDQLEATRCIDVSREVAAGISNGAGLADGLVCALNGRLAAIFPVAGVNILRPCATARPTTVIAFHGTADELVPYEGGVPFSGVKGGSVAQRLSRLISPQERALYNRIHLQPVETAVGAYAQQFGCTGPAVTRPASGITLRTYGGCTGNAAVALYTVDGGGHTWPGGGGSGTESALGMTTQAISASQIIVDTVKGLRTR